jgi:cytochrome d ubiquinol oxidase subunit II
MAIAFGVVALAATAFTGASFLVGDARRFRPPYNTAPDLVEYFRRRTLWAAVALLVVSSVTLLVIANENFTLFRGMVTGLGLPFAVIAVLSVLAVAALMWGRAYLWYRFLTVVGVGSFVFAWAFGQLPYLLPGRLTIQQAAGAPGIEVLLLIIIVVAFVLVAPSLFLLYVLDQRSALVS